MIISEVNKKSMAKQLHAFSVDIEDWYQSSFDFNAPISELCVHNTRKVMTFLSQHNTKGTFFIQGMVAEKYPELVAEIDAGGHEVQSHGYSHRPVNKMTRVEFKDELMKTSRLIENITGKPVTGYRAPDFTIDRTSFWAFEEMYKCGIRYDSSVFPMKTRRYGIKGFEAGYSQIRAPSGSIHELPVSVFQPCCLNISRIPVGGGGYVRLFPLFFLKYCLRALDMEESPFIIYCHPYEFNPQEWKQIIKNVPMTRRIHQGLGRKNFQKKISGLLRHRAFGKISDVLEAIKEKTYAHSIP